MDAEYNLCDMIVSVSTNGVYCPLKPGIYHGLYNGTIPKVFWPVSKTIYYY